MTIRKRDGFHLVSGSGKNLGTAHKAGVTPGSKRAAQVREKQVEFFKRLKKSRGGKGSLAAKVRKKSLVKRTKGR